MSIRSSVQVALSVCLLLVAASAARGDEPCTCESEPTRDIVDFTRPPSKIAPQNKVRVEVQPDKDPKTGAVTIEVQGQAYFPDGTVIVVTARHWKSKTPFASSRTALKDRVFSCKLGPFQKKIPAGGIVVGAFYIENAQTPTIQKLVLGQHYYHNKVPCKHDRACGWEATFSLGGAEAEALDEADEKSRIEAAKKNLLEAKKSCDDVLADVEKKAKANNAATAAIEKLDKELKDVAEVMNLWARGRQMFLFPNRMNQLSRLRSLIRDQARFRAAAAGVPVQGINAADAPAKKEELSKEVTKISDDLKGFIDDPHAIDTAWDENNPAAGSNQKAAPGGQAEPPKK